MEASFEHPHENYRLFISSEPAPDPISHIIPQVLLYLFLIFINKNENIFLKMLFY